MKKKKETALPCSATSVRFVSFRPVSPGTFIGWSFLIQHNRPNFTVLQNCTNRMQSMAVFFSRAGKV
jgi:hypothetical protein